MIDAHQQKTDRKAEAGVRAWLVDQDQVRRGMAHCQVGVVGGRATLSGNTRSRTVARGIALGTARVRGVDEVVNNLVADDELEIGVAGAIGRGAVNRTSRLIVRSDFGRVRIGGFFATASAEAEARRVGAAFPGVAEATGLRATDLSP